MQSQVNYDTWAVPVTPNTNRYMDTEYAPMKTSVKPRNQVLFNIILIVTGIFICGFPLAFITARYVQQRPTDSTTAPSTSATAVASTTSLTIPSQCTLYTTNTDSTRNIAFGSGSSCDNTLTAGWYRFMGGAGNYLVTNYVSINTCATVYAGSFNGSLPSTVGATTNGTLCLNNNGYLCYTSWSGAVISVTNCNGYYVYYLQPITHCNARYCTTN